MGRPYREPGPIKHGTLYGYVARGCRCTDCKAAKSDSQRKAQRRMGEAPHAARWRLEGDS